MKVWIACVLLFAAITLRTAAAEAIETEPEPDQKLSVETTDFAVEESADAVEDKDEPLKEDAAAKFKSAICPSGWVSYGSRCIRLMRSGLSWLNAEAQCAAEQAKLATVHSIGEDQFLQSVLDMAGLTKAWIGAYNFQGTWMWVDAAQLSYINWNLLMAAEASGPCVVMRNNDGWYSSDCAFEYAYFCAIDYNTC